MKRRHFLSSTVAILAATIAYRSVHSAASKAPKILLRSSWQEVNIGDIAHTPGVLALIEQYIPDAEVTLWASADLSEPVAAMMRHRFPKLKIVKGSIGKNGRASNDDLNAAIDATDFLLHGSGPSLVAAKDVAAFVEHTKKPFGVYGITHGSFLSGDDKQLLGQAKFVFFRDSVSLEKAISESIACPILKFAPDAAFAFDLHDDVRAREFMYAQGLKPQQFLCCLSRLRYTPYWSIPGSKRAFDEKRHRRNEEMKDHDHEPLRQSIIDVVRNTPLKVLLCPEDMTQMAVGKEQLLEKLPDDVRRRVVWHEGFWLPDEALSIYRMSAGLFGSEMHSPIMAVGNGIPAIVCRFEEQTSKGIMWRDIGLGDWLFNLDEEVECAQVPKAVLSMAQDLPRANRNTSSARNFVMRRQFESMEIVRKALA